MAETPQGLVLKRHRDLRTFAFNRPLRWGMVAALGAFLLLGLVNTFGQRPQTQVLDTPAARLELYAPARLRGGLLFEARFTITAHHDLKNAALLLSPGWSEGIQHNTADPNPIGEGSRDGDLLLTLGHIAAGHVYRLFEEFQVNATNIAWHRRADVALYDGARRLGTIHRTVTVYP